MKDRIIQFLRSENKTSSQFAEEIGVQASSVSHVLSGRNKASLDFVTKMLSTYKSIRPEWLLFGNGDMLNESGLSDLFNTEDKDEAGKDHYLSEKEAIEEDSLRSINTDEQDIIDSRDTLENKRKASTDRIVIFHTDGSFSEYTPK